MFNNEISFKIKIDDRPKVSIIVPVYNVEKWLPECLDSLINQTLEDIEIICVDDGSKDKSGEILEEYAEKDEERIKVKIITEKIKNKEEINEDEIKGRIRVIHQENKGISAARNLGLNVASGEYVAFLDPDDYVHPECYKTVYKLTKKYNIDIIQFDNNNIMMRKSKNNYR